MADWIKAGGVTFDGQTVTAGNEGGPVRGATARVETSGDIQRRITATRLVLTGPFALAFRKKKDHRTLYLTIEGRGWSIVREVKPKEEGNARRLAAAVNAAGSV